MSKYFCKYADQIGLPLHQILTSEEAQDIIDKNLTGYFKGRVKVNKGEEYVVEEIVDQLARLDQHIDDSVKKALN